MYRSRLINDSFGSGLCFGLRGVLNDTDAFGIEDEACGGQRAAIHCLQRLAPPCYQSDWQTSPGDRRILSGQGRAAKAGIYESLGQHGRLNR